jgi:adenosylcobinamide-GDP ribazoletransferase
MIPPPVPNPWWSTRASLGLVAVLLVLGYLGTWYRRRLGGYTGDTLGAAQQLTELTFYLAIDAAAF